MAFSTCLVNFLINYSIALKICRLTDSLLILLVSLDPLLAVRTRKRIAICPLVLELLCIPSWSSNLPFSAFVPLKFFHLLQNLLRHKGLTLLHKFFVCHSRPNVNPHLCSPWHTLQSNKSSQLLPLTWYVFAPEIATPGLIISHIFHMLEFLQYFRD